MSTTCAGRNRDGGNIDVTEMASVLVANTDPTASRQLRELERGLALLPFEQREAILLVGLEGNALRRGGRRRRRTDRHGPLAPVARPGGAAAHSGDRRGGGNGAARFRRAPAERFCRGSLIRGDHREGRPARREPNRPPVKSCVAGPPVSRPSWPPRGCMSAALASPVVIPREATHSETVRARIARRDRKKQGCPSSSPGAAALLSARRRDRGKGRP